uniref:Tyrosine-protein kinase receptor Tie-1 n=1 Tax=Cacopsylla melanoneura TaxID=428564 RepID=A0A8D8WM38_9HEMI
MNFSWRLLFVLVLTFGNPINGTNDITTVYKINTIKSDMNEVKYLNTCTVSVRVQPQDEQFPLFNINDNSSILDWRQIPPLYSTQPSNWTVVKDDNKMNYLPPVHSDYINPFQLIDMNLMLLKGHSFLKHTFPNHDDISYTEDPVSNGLYIYENENKRLAFPMDEAPTEKGLFSLRVFDIRSCFRETSFSVKLYWSMSNDNFIQIIIDHTDNITVCTVNNRDKHCDQFPFIFSAINWRSCHYGSWFGVLLEDDEINIYNFLGNGQVQFIHTNHRRPEGFHTFTKLRHEFLGRPAYPIMYYEIRKIQPMPLHSPWFKLNANTSLYILYFTKPGHKLNVFVEEESTGNTTQLKQSELDRSNYTGRIERVLTRVPVGILHRGTGNQRISIIEDKDVFIGNIWERTNLDMHKERAPIVCKKSNIIDIYNYNTVDRTIKNTKNESSCKNGGRLENGNCVCPPGFVGSQCESPCGRNHFGEKCSFVCSNSSNECKGMILCTPYYGCTCAPGYYGDECNMQCKEGFYGADCKQTCKQCPYGCNKYTGACRDKCSKRHLKNPSCSKNNFYLRDAPEIVESNFTSVTLQVNFAASKIKIVGSLKLDKPNLYTVQYREDLSPIWNNGPYEEFNQVITNITVNGLKPGLLYEFRVVLIDYSQETQDTLRSKIIQAETNCTLSLRQQNLQISSISFRAIGLTWDKETALEEMECPIIDYLLEMDEMIENGLTKSKQPVQVKGNSYSIENLNPGKTYSITLKRETIFGESEPIASKDVTTDDDRVTKLIVYKTTSNRIGLRWNMPNINLTIIRINIELLDLSYKIWNKTIDMSIILHSYQCKPWPGFTCYDVTELVMNTKYNITVKLSSVEYTQYIVSKSIVAETKETSPSSVRDVKVKLVSDTSMSLSWRIPLYLNGILRKFLIEVEHLSSFVKETCYQSSTIDYTVSAEVEMYSHILQDIKLASSYQITIRPLVKGLGPNVSETIETPPPRIRFQRTVEYNNKTLKLKQMDNHIEDSIEIYNQLISEILVIVEPKFNTNQSSKRLTGFRSEMSEILGSNNWWLTHVCAATDETCTVDLALQAESTDILPYYGKLERKHLQSGYQYRIWLVQVSKYLSARSYTTELFSIFM